MTQLVQILLPFYDNNGRLIPRKHFNDVLKRLTERFGGTTAYMRAPAEGRWNEDGADTTTDEIVIIEVMVERLDAGWWGTFRQSLETTFEQKEIIVRAQRIRCL